MGDFVKVVCNEIVPADLLLVHTSDPNGVCHIETSNLDGETNLKQRRAMSGLCVSVRSTYSSWVLLCFYFSYSLLSLCAASPFSSSLSLIFNTSRHYLVNIYSN